VVCSKCGEVNSDNFRFCGMCGTLLDGKLDTRLEARRPVVSTAPGLSSPALSSPSLSSPGLPKTANATEPLRPVVTENPAKTVNQPVAAIGGPSVLGLNQPSMDSLREKAFSGLDSFFEPEQPETGGRRTFLMVVLLAALGGAGWWTYTNYLGATEPRKAVTPTSTAADMPSRTSASKGAASEDDASAAQPAAPSTTDPVVPAENTATPSGISPKVADGGLRPSSEQKPMPITPAPKAVAAAAVAPVEKRPAKREPAATSAKAPSLPTPVAPDTGDAAFHKGEAYLYGRGIPENCDEAVKNLKAASAKSNAKARGAFGTMYATGHCVPRDLPTSYLWFAMALRVDPNNQILEKDLNAIWNQMTPPERQMATRMKE
jgi:hypothetical protein